MHLSILLTAAPLDPAALLAAATHPDAGGIATFLGVTRAETDPAKGPLLELDYDAYPEMADKELRRLALAAADRWPILAAAIHHRLGPVRIGEASMIVAIATPHRQDAFDACRWLVDELKKTVPIWKQERYTTGTRWQGDPSSSDTPAAVTPPPPSHPPANPPASSPPAPPASNAAPATPPRPSFPPPAPPPR